MANSPRQADVFPERDRIAQRAYERYEARGREDGQDQQDWLEAEREFEQHTSGSATTPEPRSERATAASEP